MPGSRHAERLSTPHPCTLATSWHALATPPTLLMLALRRCSCPELQGRSGMQQRAVLDLLGHLATSDMILQRTSRSEITSGSYRFQFRGSNLSNKE